jgi:hypothetical protein
MAVNLIVLAITLMMAGFLLVWVCFPKLRPWIEAPKYRILTWQQRFRDPVVRGGTRNDNPAPREADDRPEVTS